MGWRNLSKTVEKAKKILQPMRSRCTQRKIVREAHTGLMSLSVRPSIHLNTKTRRFLMQELKLGCLRGVFCPSSIPSEYLFLYAGRKFGFNKKISRNVLIFYVYYQPNSCTKQAEHEWAGGTFLRQWKKLPSAHTQRVYLEEHSDQSPHRINLEERSEGSPHRINVSIRPSVHPEYQNTLIFNVGIKIRVSMWSYLFNGPVQPQHRELH